MIENSFAKTGKTKKDTKIFFFEKGTLSQKQQKQKTEFSDKKTKAIGKKTKDTKTKLKLRTKTVNN